MRTGSHGSAGRLGRRRLGVDAGIDGGSRGGDGTVRRRLGRQRERGEQAPHGVEHQPDLVRPWPGGSYARTDLFLDELPFGRHLADKRGDLENEAARSCIGRPVRNGGLPAPHGVVVCSCLRIGTRYHQHTRIRRLRIPSARSTWWPTGRRSLRSAGLNVEGRRRGACPPAFQGLLCSRACVGRDRAGSVASMDVAGESVR